MTEQRCQSCHAEVRWAVNVETGARLILEVAAVAPDAELKPGMVVVAENGESARVLRKRHLGPLAVEYMRVDAAHCTGRIFEPHWAKCPQAREWQGRSRSVR